ncbi:Uncharacterized protein TCAP_00108 [Tolypocladium capitatum]|uniref:Serine hydrolase domain-containing protein n=1 Tax=Tolypocladium capitatum TaxID=45235 RepID=A0A2K3QR12_9HYPO|nr:Uncharacterized protein TCAP_00108 [Tolypocladium capitatum]
MAHSVFDKPRILCLHGGGASAQIFQAQMRYISKYLQHHFRFVFVDAPWISDKHPALKPAFPHMNPCYRWARWLEEQPPLEEASAANEVEVALMNAMADDEGTGEWVGLLGFSQGAKMAFSILQESQLRARENRMLKGYAGVHWQFGIIMAGRGPPLCLSSLSRQRKGYSSFTQLPYYRDESMRYSLFGDRLQIPTLHVHGLRDEGLEAHRELLAYYTAPEYARLIEWDGGHRLPIKSEDVRRVAEAIKEDQYDQLDVKPYRDIEKVDKRGEKMDKGKENPSCSRFMILTYE